MGTDNRFAHYFKIEVGLRFAIPYQQPIHFRKVHRRTANGRPAPVFFPHFICRVFD
jgi:hypothetical protein